MKNHPALGLLMYDFLGRFKERLSCEIQENKKCFGYYVSDNRLKILERSTLDFIGEKGELKSILYRLENDSINYDKIGPRLTSIVCSQVEKALESEVIQERYEYLIWPYFFVKTIDEGNKESMMTWFPDKEISKSIKKDYLYPTHYLNSHTEEYQQECADEDNDQLWGFLEKGSDEGAIQEILKGKNADSAGIQSFQNKIYTNLFLRPIDEFDSFKIDCYTGNFSLWQSKVQHSKNGDNEGLIALCSPLIGFFNPINNHNTPILIEDGQNDFNINKTDFYNSIINAFIEENGYHYLKSFKSELDNISNEINLKSVSESNRKFKEKILGHRHTIFNLIPDPNTELSNIEKAINCDYPNQLSNSIKTIKDYWDILFVTLHFILKKQLPKKYIMTDISSLLNWFKNRSPSDKKTPNIDISTNHRVVISDEYYENHFLLFWNLWHNARKQYPSSREDTFHIRLYTENNLYCVDFRNKGEMIPDWKNYLKKGGSLPDPTKEGLKVIRDICQNLGYNIRIITENRYTNIIITIPQNPIKEDYYDVN